MEKKCCSVCEMLKSLDEFSKDNRASDGRASNCKSCQSIKRKAWADKQEERPRRSDVKANAILAAGEKKCSKCGEIRPLSEYHADKRNKDGLYGHCKSCHQAMTRAYEQSDHGKAVVSQSKKKAYEERGGRERTRIQNAKPESREKRAEYRQTEAGKAAQRRKDEKRKREQAQKLRAKTAVSNAVKSGKLAPVRTLRCHGEGCTNQAVEYHHSSYAEEDLLRVVPFCKQCHAKTYTQPHE